MTNIDLINWTVQEAQYLKSKPREPESIDDGIPSLDAFLAMMESELAKGQEPAQSDSAGTAESQIGVAQRADEALPHDKAIGVTGAAEAASPASAQVVSSTLTEEQPVRIISSPTSISVTGVQVVGAAHDAPAVPEPKLSDSPPVTRAAPSTSPEAQNGAPALLMALKQTDYRTARADRERAIVLRWALRDILGKRLKLSPISHDDLQTLMAFGLVEMQGDSPTLTQAGLGVIA